VLDPLTAERSGSPEELAAGAVIEKAGVVLSGRRSDIPVGFVAQLFGRVAADDVLGYGADDLARLSERAFDFLKQRTPGTSKIHCGTVRLTASGERKSVT
jgi:hypothetical protein